MVKLGPTERSLKFVLAPWMTHLASAPNLEAERSARVQSEFARLFAVTPAMLHSIDMEGRLVLVSDAWLTKLGYARQEVLGRLSTDFLTPESRERAIRDLLPEFFRSGRCENVEYQMVCKDGLVIDVLLSAILDCDPTNYRSSSLTAITDVTNRKAAERQLAESEACYRGLIEDQSELVSLATPEGELRFVNHAYARLYKKQPREMLGKNLYDYVPEEQRAAVAEHLRTVCSLNQSFESENQVRLPDGQTRWIAWTNRALIDDKGRVTFIHSVGRDVERRVVAEQRLKESETRYRLLAEHGVDMVFQLDLELVRRYVSPACREILGYEPEELVGVKPVSMVHPEDAEHLAQVFRSLLEGRLARHSIINRIRHRDGRWIWVEAQLKTLKDPKTGAPSGIVGNLRDISLRKAVENKLAEANRRLEALAGQDGLTGLANRRGFDKTLPREYDRARRDRKCLGLIMIDVDWFKSFNDRYGHPAGDKCLKQISEAIRTVIYRPGDFAARFGGEEFAVLLPDTDERRAAAIAERIRQTILLLALEHNSSSNDVVTISAGVASTVRNASDPGPECLLQNADRALYRAKANGRNTVVRASSMGPWLATKPSTAA